MSDHLHRVVDLINAQHTPEDLEALSRELETTANQAVSALNQTVRQTEAIAEEICGDLKQKSSYTPQKEIKFPHKPRTGIFSFLTTLLLGSGAFYALHTGLINIDPIKDQVLPFLKSNIPMLSSQPDDLLVTGAITLILAPILIIVYLLLSSIERSVKMPPFLKRYKEALLDLGELTDEAHKTYSLAKTNETLKESVPLLELTRELVDLHQKEILPTIERVSESWETVYGESFPQKQRITRKEICELLADAFPVLDEEGHIRNEFASGMSRLKAFIHDSFS